MNPKQQNDYTPKVNHQPSSINQKILRIASMLLDHFFMCFIIVPPWMLLMILMTSGVVTSYEQILNIALFMMVFIYLNKDFLRAKSPAKRIIGFQIINRKNGTPATALQCFIRNLTIALIWPLEVIVGFINPERRIGDFIANTKVIKTESENLKTIWTDIKQTKLKLDMIGILILGSIYCYGLSLLLPGMN
jgi:uncharacterized RDD family membrane protein YckC